MSGSRLTLVLPFLVTALAAAAARAQSAGQPAGQGSGPVRELSTNVGTGSGPVRGSVGAAMNDTPVRSGPVRGSVTGDVTSGPVSDISVGPVTADNPMAGGGTIGQASAGAVKKDMNSPLGERISQPLRELGPLQERLRAIQPVPRDAAVPPEEGVQFETTGMADEEAPTTAQQDEPTEQAGEGEPEAATDDDLEATPDEETISEPAMTPAAAEARP
jgi:hypothetical protein